MSEQFNDKVEILDSASNVFLELDANQQSIVINAADGVRTVLISGM